MVEHLRKAGVGAGVATIFLYCDYRDRVNQTSVNMIGSLARQLALQVPSIPTAIWELYKEIKKKEQPINVETLQKLINIFVQFFDRIYICVDALDECQSDTRRQLLEFLKSISGTIVRMFVTSRPNIEAELAGSLVDKSTSKIPIAANREDLEIFLSQRFLEDRYPEAMDEKLRAQITNKIIEWSQGM